MDEDSLPELSPKDKGDKKSSDEKSSQKGADNCPENVIPGNSDVGTKTKPFDGIFAALELAGSCFLLGAAQAICKITNLSLMVWVSATLISVIFSVIVFAYSRPSPDHSVTKQDLSGLSTQLSTGFQGIKSDIGNVATVVSNNAARSGPRHLSEAQVQILTKLLNLGPKGPVMMSSIMNDKEGEVFREELATVLEANGFKVPNFTVFMSIDPLDIGIRIFCKGPPAPAHIGTICHAFIEAGLLKAPVKVGISRSSSNLASNQVEVCIGAKP